MSLRSLRWMGMAQNLIGLALLPFVGWLAHAMTGHARALMVLGAVCNVVILWSYQTISEIRGDEDRLRAQRLIRLSEVWRRAYCEKHDSFIAVLDVLQSHPDSPVSAEVALKLRSLQEGRGELN